MKCMFFVEKNGELLEKYDEILHNVGNTIKKKFDNEPFYNEKYLRNKVKSYEGKISTNFHKSKITKQDSQCIYLSVILIGSIFIRGKNYPQVFLEECKFKLKKKKCLNILPTIQKFFLIKNILMKKVLVTLIKNILMKKATLRKQFK